MGSRSSIPRPGRAHPDASCADDNPPERAPGGPSTARVPVTRADRATAPRPSPATLILPCWACRGVGPLEGPFALLTGGHRAGPVGASPSYTPAARFALEIRRSRTMASGPQHPSADSPLPIPYNSGQPLARVPPTMPPIVAIDSAIPASPTDAPVSHRMMTASDAPKQAPAVARTMSAMTASPSGAARHRPHRPEPPTAPATPINWTSDDGASATTSTLARTAARPGWQPVCPLGFLTCRPCTAYVVAPRTMPWGPPVPGGCAAQGVGDGGGPGRRMLWILYGRHADGPTRHARARCPGGVAFRGSMRRVFPGRLAVSAVRGPQPGAACGGE